MPTPSERKALLFLAAAAFLGVGVRTARSVAANSEPTNASRGALAAQIAAVSEARANGSVKQKPKTADLVDVDRATLVQLQALPRVGPALARRIVAHRDSAGPFGSLEHLDQVKGIGPAVLRELAPRVTFSTTPRPLNASTSKRPAASRVAGAGNPKPRSSNALRR